MALNTAHEAIEARRLELVASFRLRKFTQREIQEKVAEVLKNPATDEPYSLGTINADIKKLEREWRKAAAAATEQHKAQQLAELQEVKRQAWATNDLTVVLRAIGAEIDITGTKAPAQTEITGKDGGPLENTLRVSPALTLLLRKAYGDGNSDPT